jgi:hypothetical protein
MCLSCPHQVMHSPSPWPAGRLPWRIMVWPPRRSYFIATPPAKIKVAERHSPSSPTHYDGGINAGSAPAHDFLPAPVLWAHEWRTLGQRRPPRIIHQTPHRWSRLACGTAGRGRLRQPESPKLKALARGCRKLQRLNHFERSRNNSMAMVYWH